MVTIHLADGVASALSDLARAQGMSLEQYLANLAANAGDSKLRMSVEELDRMLDEEASPGPVINGTFSRAEIYDDHD